MPIPKRARDGNQIAKLVVGMATGDKDEILNPSAPPARAASAKARAASRTPERRREIARKAAAARWGK